MTYYEILIPVVMLVVIVLNRDRIEAFFKRFEEE